MPLWDSLVLYTKLQWKQGLFILDNCVTAHRQDSVIWRYHVRTSWAACIMGIVNGVPSGPPLEMRMRIANGKKELDYGGCRQGSERASISVPGSTPYTAPRHLQDTSTQGRLDIHPPVSPYSRLQQQSVLCYLWLILTDVADVVHLKCVHHHGLASM